MKRLPITWPLLIILATIVTALVVFVTPEIPLRPFIVMAFLFICPGMVLVQFFHLDNAVAEWTLAVVLSFAIDALVGSIFLYAGIWSPTGILNILLGFSVSGAIIHIVTTMRSASASLARRPYNGQGRLSILIPIALTLLIGLILGLTIWSLIHYSPRTVTPTSPTIHQQTNAFSPAIRETATSITAGISYYGTIYNVPTSVTTSMSLTDVHMGTMHGSFTGLSMNSSYNGILSTSQHIQFNVIDAIQHITLSFEGNMLTDGTLTGSYCTLNQQGQCSGTNSYGIWSVAPTRS